MQQRRSEDGAGWLAFFRGLVARVNATELARYGVNQAGRIDRRAPAVSPAEPHDLDGDASGARRTRALIADHVVIHHGRIAANAGIDALLADAIERPAEGRATSDRPSLECSYLRVVTSTEQVRP
jgi:hypothetical protein